MKMRFLPLFLFALAVCGQDIPSAPNAHVVTVSAEGGHYTEPSIAINPRNPKQVLVVFQGGKYAQGTATAAYSSDGGITFTRATGTDSSDWKVLGDVTTIFDNAGNAYVCSIAFDKLGTTSYWALGAGRNGIVVRRSPDGGKTWDATLSNVKTYPTGHEPDLQFEDEPRIYADNSPASPNLGTLYVGWVEWQLTQSVMFISRSTDQAKTWSKPVRVSTKAGLPRDDNGGLAGYTQTIGPDGTIYASWSDGNTIVFTTSHDGGRTFSPSTSVIPTGPTYFSLVPSVGRVQGFPVIAMDIRQGKGNHLYLCWSDYTNGDVDVFIASSSNHGHTWSAPVRVNTDPIHNGKDQFFHWLAVDPITGYVYVDFYDRRADLANRNTSVTIARSTDGAKTFQNYNLSDAAFNPGNAFLGDYTWIDVLNNHVVVTWTEATKTRETIIKVASADFH